MNILFLTSGELAPSSRFRVQSYIAYLEARGHRCTLRPSRPQKYVGLPLLGNRLSEPVRIGARCLEAAREIVSRHDVTFLEREILSSSCLLVERLFRSLSRRLVLDVDDAIFLLNPGKFDRLVRMADHVIVANNLLRDRVISSNPAVTVVPTVVDVAQYLVHEHAAERTTIGWIGTAGNYRYLEAVVDALNRLAERHVFELMLVAERKPPADLLRRLRIPVRFAPWSAAEEASLLASFDIGIMPLFDDEWCRYKAGAKLIQYMATGIPAVASPVGVNAEIVRSGQSGYLASSAEEWVESLSRLMGSPPLRSEMGRTGRAIAEAEFSAARWAPVIENVLSGRACHT